MKTKNFLKDLIHDVLNRVESDRTIARRYHCSKTTIGKRRARCAELGLTWSTVEPMGLSELRQTLKKEPESDEDKNWAERLDFAAIRREVELPGMTLWTWWEEQRALDSSFVSYSRLAALFQQHGGSKSTSLRLKHEPGERCQVDFSGTRPWYFNERGEKVHVEMFVAAMPLSGKVFATCRMSQRVMDWISAHLELFNAWGVVAKVLVPDNLRSGVSKSGKRPWIQPLYYEMAKHYNVAVLPAPPGCPTAKATAELSVKLVKRAFLPILRHRQFFSLQELNEALAARVAQLNAKRFKRRPESRQQRFDRLDRPAMQALPREPFRFLQWTAAQKVPSDYHVPVNGHFYSVPFGLVGQRVEARSSEDSVEIFSDGLLVATHVRSTAQGDFTTDRKHQPENHRAMEGRTPEALIAWAAGVGSATEVIMRGWFDRKIPLQGLPAGLELKNMGLRAGAERLEQVAQRALQLNLCTPSGLERLMRAGGPVTPATPARAALAAPASRRRGQRVSGPTARRTGAPAAARAKSSPPVAAASKPKLRRPGSLAVRMGVGR